MAIIVKNIASKFAAGVSEAKSMGGRFDGATKLWTLDEARVRRYAKVTIELYGEEGIEMYLKARGLKLVEGATANTAPVRHSSECPSLMGGVCECDGR